MLGDTGGNDDVDNVLQNIRDHQIHQGADDLDYKAEGHHGQVRFDIADQKFQGPLSSVGICSYSNIIHQMGAFVK